MSEIVDAREGPMATLAKNLPYKKWWFWLILVILIRVVVMSYESSKPVSYDHVALGFSSDEAMQAAFAKGYHTRQKMEEMARFYADGPSAHSVSAKH